jgi:hypothetical protein
MQAVQTQPKEDAMRWLAGRIANECKDFGSSEDDVLKALQNRGIECSYVKNRKRLFRVPGETVQVYASEVIRALQEEVRNGSGLWKRAESVEVSGGKATYITIEMEWEGIDRHLHSRL